MRLDLLLFPLLTMLINRMMLLFSTYIFFGKLHEGIHLGYGKRSELDAASTLAAGLYGL